jgi:hypothetical protein
LTICRLGGRHWRSLYLQLLTEAVTGMIEALILSDGINRYIVSLGYFRTAIWWANSRSCYKSYVACKYSFENLGYALHPMQDISGHLDLTPCEHLQLGNNQYIDSQRYKPGKLLRVESVWNCDPAEGWHCPVANHYCKCDQEAANEGIRVFDWPVDTNLSRYRRARKVSKGVIKIYLEAVGCNCTELVP